MCRNPKVFISTTWHSSLQLSPLKPLDFQQKKKIHSKTAPCWKSNQRNAILRYPASQQLVRCHPQGPPVNGEGIACFSSGVEHLRCCKHRKVRSVLLPETLTSLFFQHDPPKAKYQGKGYKHFYRCLSFINRLLTAGKNFLFSNFSPEAHSSTHITGMHRPQGIHYFLIQNMHL